MPVTGMIPIVMPMFWNTCHASSASTPAAISVPEQVAGELGGSADPEAQKPYEQQHQHRAEQPELLADGREHEVGVLLGHVAAVGHRPVEEALAGQPALADGRLGVVDLAGRLPQAVLQLGVRLRRP